MLDPASCKGQCIPTALAHLTMLHRPFVMNTQEEIIQAFRDYQNGRLQNNDDDVWAAWEDQ